MLSIALEISDPAPLTLAELGGRQQLGEGKNSGQWGANVVRQRRYRQFRGACSAGLASRFRLAARCRGPALGHDARLCAWRDALTGDVD